VPALAGVPTEYLAALGAAWLGMLIVGLGVLVRGEER